jgi:hypothetical protein
MKILSRLVKCKQWIIRIVMVRYFFVVISGKGKLLNKIKKRMVKEYLLWTIRNATHLKNRTLRKKDYPFCVATSAELGLELGMSVNDALDFHNDLNGIINAP